MLEQDHLKIRHFESMLFEIPFDMKIQRCELMRFDEILQEMLIQQLGEMHFQ